MAKTEILEKLGLDKEKPMSVISERDMEGDKNLTIIIQGNENEGYLDQTVSAARLLIDNVFNQLSKDADGMLQYKAFMSILDNIGACIRAGLPYSYEGMNIELVKEYIDWFMRDNLHQSKEFRDLLDQREEE